MNAFKLLVSLDHRLCKLLGFASPWNVSVQTSIVKKLYSLILYVVTCAGFYATESFTFWNSSLIVYRLAQCSVILILVETFLNAYNYNTLSGTFFRFNRRYTKNERYLSCILQNAANRTGLKNFDKVLLLCLLNCLGLLVNSIVAFYTFSFIKFLMILRRLVVLSITLQWSLCMCDVDDQFSRIRRLVKVSLEPDHVPNNVPRKASSTDRNNAWFKQISVEKFATVIEVYRMVTERRRSVNDYYAIHLAFNIGTIIYSVVVSAYSYWFKISRARNGISGHFAFFKMCVDVVNVWLIASICEAGTKQVNH